MKKQTLFGIILCIILLSIAIFMIKSAIKDAKTPYEDCLHFVAEKFCSEDMWNGSGSWALVSFDLKANSFGCQIPCGHSGIKTYNFSADNIRSCTEIAMEIQK